jgi:hypothetical protein
MQPSRRIDDDRVDAGLRLDQAQTLVDAEHED